MNIISQVATKGWLSLQRHHGRCCSTVAAQLVVIMLHTLLYSASTHLHRVILLLRAGDERQLLPHTFAFAHLEFMQGMVLVSQHLPIQVQKPGGPSCNDGCAYHPQRRAVAIVLRQ